MIYEVAYEDIDFPALFGIYERSMRALIHFHFGWNSQFQHKNIKRLAEAGQTRGYIRDGRLVGFSIIREGQTEIRLFLICVDPWVQRCGVGGHAVARLQELAVAAAKPLVGTVLATNPALGFYERSGFRCEEGPGPHHTVIFPA